MPCCAPSENSDLLDAGRQADLLTGSHGGAAWGALQHHPSGRTSRPRTHLKDCPGEPGSMQELTSVYPGSHSGTGSPSRGHAVLHRKGNSLRQTHMENTTVHVHQGRGLPAKPPRLAAPTLRTQTSHLPQERAACQRHFLTHSSWSMGLIWGLQGPAEAGELIFETCFQSEKPCLWIKLLQATWVHNLSHIRL